MTAVNSLSVEEFTLGLVTQLLSREVDYHDDARYDFTLYEGKFDVVVFLTGMIEGLLEREAVVDDHGYSVPPAVVWQQYLLDWQQSNNDGR